MCVLERNALISELLEVSCSDHGLATGRLVERLDPAVHVVNRYEQDVRARGLDRIGRQDADAKYQRPDQEGLTPAHSSTSDSVAIPNARRQFLQAYPLHEQGRMLLLRSRFPERLPFAIVRNRKGRCRNTLRAVHVEQIGSRLLHSRSRPPCGAPSTTSGRGNRGYPIANWSTGERLVALCLDVEGKRAPVGIEVHAFAVACCGRVDVRARDRRPVLRCIRHGHRLNAARTQLHRGRLQCSPRAPPQRFRWSGSAGEEEAHRRRGC